MGNLFDIWTAYMGSIGLNFKFQCPSDSQQDNNQLILALQMQIMDDESMTKQRCTVENL